jgi:hypothetical protein
LSEIFITLRQGVMKRKYLKYEKYFAEQQQARILIRVTDNRTLDRNTVITSITADRVHLEILGEGVPENEPEKITGAGVTFSVSSGWGFFSCDGLLEKVINGKEIYIRLSGDVNEQQRRDYFRFDLVLPLHWTVPGDQHIASVTQKWKEKRERYLAMEPAMLPHDNGYKVVRWLGGDDLPPQTVNLSGGGLRIKTHDCVEVGTKVLVDIFLPLAPSRAIMTIAEVVRCTEIRLNLERGASFATAMKFVEIDEKDREMIISFIFSEQRSKLQASRDKRT